MTTDHDGMQLLQQANPVPDPRVLHVEPDADRYLRNLLATRDPVRNDTSPRRHTAVIWALCAALTALLVGGVVLIGTQGDSDMNPVDAPTTPPTSTFDGALTVIEAPAGTLLAESGQTMSSLVGDISWTRVDGDALSLPQEVLFEYQGRYFGIDHDGTGWRSDDARNWTETDPLPSGNNRFVELDDVVWTILDSPDPGQSPRLGWWNRGSSGAVELPGPWPTSDTPGLRVTGRTAQIDREAYEVLVIESATYGLDPANDIMELGDDVDTSDVDIRWVDDNTYQVTITQDGISRQIGPDFTLSADPSNPSIVQITSPEGSAGQVGPWPGLSAGQLISRLRTGHLEAHREVYAGNLATHFFTRAVSSIDGKILGRSTAAGVVFTVVSEGDGFGLSLLVNGNRLDEIPMSQPGPIKSMTVTGSDNGAVLQLETDPPLRAEDWFTDDGTSWQPTNAPQYLGGVLAADFGWVKSSREVLYVLDQLASTGYPLSVSADGVDWQDISIDLDINPEVGERPPIVIVTVAADTIFVSVDDGENRTLWVGDVHHP